MKFFWEKMNQYRTYIVIFLCLCQLIIPSLALRDPSAVYCHAVGYNFTIESSPAGEIGYCILNDGKKVDSWRFLQGQDAAESGFCVKNGYLQKIVNDPKICIQFLTDSCSVCVLPNGSEIEITKLMNLNFNDSRCGDNVCGFPENHKICPSDCPSGASDRYCDGILDGKCDRDCRKKFGADLDCPVAGLPVIYILGITLVVVIAGVGYLVLKKSKRN